MCIRDSLNAYQGIRNIDCFILCFGERDRVFQETFVSNVDGILCPFLYKWMQIIESVAWLHEIEVQNNPDVVIYRHIDTVQG